MHFAGTEVLEGDFKEIVAQLQLRKILQKFSVNDLLSLQFQNRGVLPEILY